MRKHVMRWSAIALVFPWVVILKPKRVIQLRKAVLDTCYKPSVRHLAFTFHKAIPLTLSDVATGTIEIHNLKNFVVNKKPGGLLLRALI